MILIGDHPGMECLDAIILIIKRLQKKGFPTKDYWQSKGTKGNIYVCSVTSYSNRLLLPIFAGILPLPLPLVAVVACAWLLLLLLLLLLLIGSL